MNLKRVLVGTKDECKTIYFREGYSFSTSNLPIKDGCLVINKNDVVEKAWGHSPAALLPLEGEAPMVQLVNARDGNPCDPFQKIAKGDLFSASSVKAMAKDQHYKAVTMASGTPLTTTQTVVLAFAALLFLAGATIFMIKELSAYYG